jgi:hypothetical protein
MEPDLERLRRELLEAAAIDEPTDRLLEVAAIVSEALGDLGIEPVVVGGLAVAFWSDGAYRTGDIDVVVPRVPELPERLELLGFRRLGREWLLPGRDVVFEAPAETLDPGDRGEPVRLQSGRRLVVLSPEDSLLWRLREWIYWHTTAGFRQAALLLVAARVDAARLERRAAEEGLALALDELRRLTAEADAGRELEPWELKEIAKRIERRS